MWPVSDGWVETLNSPVRHWASKIEVLYGAEVITTLDVLLRGYVGMDDVAVRRECHFTIVDAESILTPATATDLLSPAGTELRVSRGLRVDGAFEWVPLGVFGIVEPEVRAHSDGTVIEVKGFDRVDSIRARQFTDPWVIAGGTPVHLAISDIITSRLTVPTRITASNFEVPEAVFDRLSDPWDAVRKLGASTGYAAYFDQLGTAVVEPAQEVRTGVRYEPGDSSILMTSARKFDATKTYNGVIVRGEHPAFGPVRFEKWDTDTTSPTYYLGPFGKRPYGFYSDLITTAPMAEAKAEELFKQVTKVRQECTITVAGAIQHDVGDVIEIVDPRSRTTGLWTIISGTVPLRPQQGEHVRLRCKESTLTL